MKRTFLLLLLTLVLPSVVFANNSVDFTNDGGSLSGSSAGLSLSGSTLIAVNGLNGMGLVTGNLGTVSFSTGALTGSLQMGGSLAAGGSFVITGNGMNGIPNTVIFNGTFSGPVTWALITLPNGNHSYTLSGPMSGMWYAGGTVDGATIQLTVNTGKSFFNGSGTISSGNTSISPSTVPEPGSVTLLGTGLVALTGLLRGKLKK